MKIIEGNEFLLKDGNVYLDDKNITHKLRSEGYLNGNTINNLHIKTKKATILGSMTNCIIESTEVYY